MKKNYILLLLSFCFSVVKAQDTKLVAPDATKKIATIHASEIKTMKFGGSANTQSVDLNWKPILATKFVEVEHEAPNPIQLDSIKAANMLLKKAYQQLHKGENEEKTTYVTPSVGANFAGNANMGWSPLDNSLAISNSGYIVSVANDNIAYYNTSGTNLYYQNITDFLPSSFGATGVCDPDVIYDPGADRFIFFCQQAPLVSGGEIFICFSKTNNPIDGWWCYAFYGDPTSGNFNAFDYPKMAVNDSELFITGNLFSEPGGSFNQAVIFQMDKLAGYSGTTLNFVYWVGISGSPFTLLPVSYGQAADITTGMLLVSTHSSSGSDINLYQITGNWCCSPTMNYWTVATSAYSAPSNANQAGTSCLLNTGDSRCLSGFYLNGIIHFVHNVDNGSGYTAIRYNRLDIGALTNANVTYTQAGNDCAYPSVVSFATTYTDKSVMIGFGRVNPSIYPEVRVVNCDNSMAFSGATLVKSSAGYVSYTSSSVERWGDYTGTSRKHNSTMAEIWMNGSFGNTSNTWDSWIAQIKIPTKLNDIKSITPNTNVYPNPVRNNFNVEFPLDENCNVTICILDMSGKIVKELYDGKGIQGQNVFSFNKANLTNGTYLLSIKTNTKTIKNEKIIVNN